MAETYRTEGVARVRRNRAYLFAGGLPYLLGLGFLLGGALTSTWALAIPVFHMFVFGTLGFLYAYKSNKDPTLVAGPLEIDEEEVRHGGKRLARRADLTAGVLTLDKGRTHVKLRRRGPRPSVLLKADGEEEGQAVLRSLGFHASQSVVELNGASEIFDWPLAKQLAAFLLPVFLLVPAVAAGGVWLGPLGAPFVLLMILSFLAYTFGISFTPTRVRIGVDGVSTRWFNQERFIPFRSVRDVAEYKTRSGGKTYVGVELTLEDGGVERIVCGQEGWMSGDLAEMLARIREALDLCRERGGEIPPHLLARGDRSPRDWVTALRSVGAGANAGPRTPPVPAEQLLRTVEDAAAPPLVRVGAAVAAAGVGPDALERVRIAAETTAARDLRSALLRVADCPEDEEALAEVIATLEEAEAGASRRELG